MGQLKQPIIFNTAWITLNRICNLRCKWCYASETGFSEKDTMTYELASNLINFCADCGVERIILIGGEPTLYKDIIPLIKQIKEQGMISIIITNGLVFENRDILDRYIEAGIDYISLSIKGNNRQEMLDTTGVDCYDRLAKVLKNLTDSKVKYSTSQIIDKNSFSTLIDGIKFLRENGAKNINYGFCYNFNYDNNDYYKTYLKNNNPYEVAYLFKKHYEEIDKALEGCKWTLSNTIPLCAWDENTVQEMNEKDQIKSICQLQRGGSMVFDPEGNVIPCNVMYPLKLGKYGEDFNDKESYLSFRNKPEIVKIYKRLRGAPDKECLSCSKAKNCGGGCVTNWTNYTYQELIGYLKEDFLKEHK